MSMPLDPVTEAPTFPDAWVRVMTEPKAFFDDLSDTEPLGHAMTFLVICAAVDAAGTFVFRWSPLGALCVLVGVVAGAVALAAIATLVAQHLLDGKAGFEPMMRAVAYAGAPLVLAGIPMASGLTIAWMAFLAVRGVARVQQWDGLRALVTVGASLAALRLVCS